MLAKEGYPMAARMEVYAGSGDHELPNGGFIRNGSATAGTATVEDAEGNSVTISNILGGQVINWLYIKKVTAIASLSQLEIYHFAR